MFPTNHLWLSDASCLHAAMPSHASSQVVRRLSQSAALTMTSALQAVEEREHRNSDTIEPQGQFRVKRICKRDFKKHRWKVCEDVWVGEKPAVHVKYMSIWFNMSRALYCHIIMTTDMIRSIHITSDYSIYIRLWLLYDCRCFNQLYVI